MTDFAERVAVAEEQIKTCVKEIDEVKQSTQNANDKLDDLKTRLMFVEDAVRARHKQMQKLWAGIIAIMVGVAVNVLTSLFKIYV